MCDRYVYVMHVCNFHDLRVMSNAKQQEPNQRGYLPSPSLISIDASALLIDNSTIEGFAGNLSNIIRGLTVVVMAQVHFRVGVVPTRLYCIKMFCGGVHFTDDQDSSDATVNCHS
jgi:hypothetical protein